MKNITQEDIKKKSEEVWKIFDKDTNTSAVFHGKMLQTIKDVFSSGFFYGSENMAKMILGLNEIEAPDEPEEE